MVVTKRDEEAQVEADEPVVYDRLSELKAFDDTKLGVKGLVDSGITKVPRIFHCDPQQNKQSVKSDDSQIQPSIPIIDLRGINEDPVERARVVKEVQEACENWGFFQVVNHGIPMTVMEGILDGVRKFHEQNDEVKKSFYSRDLLGKKVLYNSNFDLFTSPAANWRDTFLSILAPSALKPEELPEVCRDILMEYKDQVMKLGLTLFELLSEALGLSPNHLKDIGCADGVLLLGHYYPPCPEPELTIATTKHSDSGFITLLLQDQIGGLQIFHDQTWVDVSPVPGALIINIADLLQLITNDKFKSLDHRVLANKIGPRISVACFFRSQGNATDGDKPRVYGPLRELVSEENPAAYRDLTVAEYVKHIFTKGLDGTSGLLHFRI